MLSSECPQPPTLHMDLGSWSFGTEARIQSGYKAGAWACNSERAGGKHHAAAVVVRSEGMLSHM